VVVDDLLLATSNLAYADSFRTNMSKAFDFKAMGRPSYMIGLHLQHETTCLRISQRQYILDVGERFAQRLGPFRPTFSPAPGNLRLTKTGFSDQPVSPSANIDLYRSLVGSLMYAVVSRPDVAVPVSMCARFLASPTEAHLAAARRILCYLLSTKSMALVYTRTASPTLTVYVDSSWAADQDTRRSRYGFAVFFGRALVSWRSKLHSCVSLSSAEAEYIGATEACKETMWLRFLLSEIGFPQPTTVFHEDNAACIKMTSNHIVSGRNKHMQLKMHYVRERVNGKDISLTYVSTKPQRADLLTKNMPRPAFELFRSQLLNPLSLVPSTTSMGGC